MCALARKAGYKLDWERVTPEKMIDASVKSFGADYDEMKKVILSVMAPLSAPEKRITVQLEINRIEAIHNVGKRPPFLPGHIKDPDPVREYRNQAKEILKNSRDWPGPDADIEITKKMILQGYSKERISRALKAASPELSGKASNLDAQYIGKTLEKALQAPELQKTLRSFNRGLSR
ncbi:MAG: hypothetical protein M1353_07935 [Nitrospirae bacterium]|nr:hypothetical protein [Nitrospirota bacterium]